MTTRVSSELDELAKFLDYFKVVIVSFNLRILCIVLSIDPRIDHYPLTSSPMLIAGLVFLYVYFVTEWGQKYMKSRSAYDLSSIITFYNIVQIFTNLYIFIYVSVENGRLATGNDAF